MAWCRDAFRVFNEKIKLDARRLERIDGAVARFKRFCAGDEQLRIVQSGEVFLDSSVAMKTAIRPLAGYGFDVDLVFPFNLHYFPANATPSDIVDWFVGRLKRSAFYRDRLIRLDLSVRIDYAGEFCVDIFPATRSLEQHQPFAIPGRDRESWITDDPIGFENWVATIDRRSGSIDRDGAGQFVRSVRFLKRWRDFAFDLRSGPTSTLLVTMLGNSEPVCAGPGSLLRNPLYPRNRADAAHLYDMLRLMRGNLNAARSSLFLNPTNAAEDLAREWGPLHLDEFRQRLQACVDEIGLGIDATSEADAISHYRNVFGNAFPAP